MTSAHIILSTINSSQSISTGLNLHQPLSTGRNYYYQPISTHISLINHLALSTFYQPFIVFSQTSDQLGPSTDPGPITHDHHGLPRRLVEPMAWMVPWLHGTTGMFFYVIGSCWWTMKCFYPSTITPSYKGSLCALKTYWLHQPHANITGIEHWAQINLRWWRSIKQARTKSVDCQFEGFC